LISNYGKKKAKWSQHTVKVSNIAYASLPNSNGLQVSPYKHVPSALQTNTASVYGKVYGRSRIHTISGEAPENGEEKFE